MKTLEEQRITDLVASTTRVSNGRLRTALLASTCFLGAFMAFSNASAQDAAPSGETVVVTGSRIKSNGYDRPTAVTVTTASALQAAAPMTITDGLVQLPQIVGSTSRTYCCAVGSLGNFINLRGLGFTRTLILLDGRRVAPTRESGEVDVNLLPEALVSRVDIVTGGASAAYGSDAVSGVVNYVINNRFNGVMVNAQYGESTYHDDASVKLGIAGGTSFADERGHIVASLEHFKVDGIENLTDRPDPRRYGFMGGNGSAAAPYITLENTRSILGTEGGVIISNFQIPTGSPLAGTMFLPGGQTRAFVFGTDIAGSPSAKIGGDGIIYNKMQPAGSLDTDKFYSHVTYDFSDNVRGYAQLMMSQAHNEMRVLSDNRAATSAYTIFRDNAYLPAAIAAQMDANNMTSFRLARLNADFGTIDLEYKNRSYDFSVGLDGKISDTLRWSVSFSRGETKLDGEVQNVANLSRVYNVADAVINPANGQIVCRTDLTSPGLYPGCVPMNLFGEGSPSAASKAYVLGTSTQEVTNSQNVLAAEIQGDAFNLPAGPVQYVIGAEYRRRTLVEIANPIALSQIQAAGQRGMPTALCPTVALCRFGGWHQGNFGEANAKDDVSEAFVEVQVPLLADAPMAKSLDFNGAYRVTNYQNSGSVSTWKAGITYEPFEDLRIRATTSRDIRAPNLFELFAGPVNAFTPGLTDPQTNTSNIIAITRTQGSPNLNPEEADTISYGFVYKPSWLKGLSGSVDFYDINVTGALASTTAQGTIDGCFRGNAVQCALITRDTSGTIQQIIIQQINQNGRQVRGVDYDITYATKLFGNDLVLRGLASNAIDYIDTIGTSAVQNAGWFATSTNLALPKWRGNLSATYTMGNFSIFLQERYIGSYLQQPPIPGQVFAFPKIKEIMYTDVTLRYKAEVMDHDLELYATANNLFAQRPPFVANRFVPGLAFPTVPNLYDLDNGYFTIGAKVKF